MAQRGAPRRWRLLVVLALVVTALAVAARRSLGAPEEPGHDEEAERLVWQRPPPAPAAPVMGTAASLGAPAATPGTPATDGRGVPISDGAGAPPTVAALLALTRQELYERAQARHVPGRSRMSKRELAEALAAVEQHDTKETDA